MKTANSTPSRSTIWRRKRVALGAIIRRRRDEDAKSAFIDSLARDLGLAGVAWPTAKGEHRRISMDSIPTVPEAVIEAHDPVCEALSGGRCDCDGDGMPGEVKA